MHEVELKSYNIVRTITWNKKFSHISQLYKKMKLLKLKDVYKLELAEFMHKLCCNKLSCVFQKRFIKMEKIYSHKTSKPVNLNYFLPQVAKSVEQNQLQFCGVKLWNDISEELKSKNFYDFKKIYKEILIKEY